MKLKVLALISSFLVYSFAGTSQTIYYIDSAGGNDANTGTSWSSAFRNVTKGIAASKASTAAEVQLWIKQGTYRPTDGISVLPADPFDTAFTFYRGNGIGKALKVYGGFAGTETSITSRDALHPTYLDGNLGTGRSYHIAVIVGLAPSADSVVLDGLTIRNGYGSSGFKTYDGVGVLRANGTGLYVSYDSSHKLVFRNCKFTNNKSLISSTAMGGGLYIEGSDPYVYRCDFIADTAGSSGGALAIKYSQPIFTDCNFTSNVSIATDTASMIGGSPAYGGAVYSTNSDPAFIGCNFVANRTIGGYTTGTGSGVNGGDGYGGAMYNIGCTVSLTNCSFTGNKAEGGAGFRGGPGLGGGIYNKQSSLNINNCIFTADSAVGGNATTRGGDGMGGALYLYDSTCVLNACMLDGNVSLGTATGSGSNSGSAEGGSIFSLSKLSLVNCTVKNSLAFQTAGVTSIPRSGVKGGGMCLGGVLNATGCIFQSNTATSANSYALGGAFYLRPAAQPTLDSCSIRKNSARRGGGIYNDGAILHSIKSLYHSDTAWAGGAILSTNYARLLLYKNAFVNNRSDSAGGAIMSSLAATTIYTVDSMVNNIFSKNKTTKPGSNGGALWLSKSGYFVLNNTFYADSAANRGGAISFEDNGEFTVANNIFYGNNAAGSSVDTNMKLGPAPYYPYFSAINNLYSGTNPMFVSAASPAGSDTLWGTSDDGLKLLECSPGINAGVNSLIAPFLQDIAGNTRIVNGTVDIGAYETMLISPIAGLSAVCAGSSITLTDTIAGGTWNSSNPSVATVSSTGIVLGINQGTVSISYIKSYACTTVVATINITVGLPASAIAGAGSVCVGGITSLTDAVSGGTWSSSAGPIASVGSAGIVSGISAGIAVISYIVTNACGTTNATKTITVESPAAAISGPVVVCEAETITLSDAVAGGSWSSTNAGVATISSGGVVSGISAGTTTVSYSVTNVCGNSSAQTIITVLSSAACHATAKVTPVSNEFVRVYPNPAINTLTIEAPFTVKIKISGIDGSVLKEYENAKTIDLQNYPVGILLLTVYDEHGSWINTHKVIKLN